jgi:3-dehydroquinate dehydratase/shikimate dehydrogenase
MKSLHGPTRLICSLISPVISPGVGSMRADMVEAAARGADMAECRLDHLREIPDEAALRQLLTDPPLELIVTNRPVRQGGDFVGSEEKRLEVLRLAGKFAPAFIDIEDDVPPQSWPAGKRILSHHNFSTVPPDLDLIAATLDDSRADVVKVAFAACGAEDAFRAFDVLRACRKPTIALAMGEAAVCSRILARKFGAMGTFAAIKHGEESAPGQPTVDEFKSLYRWDFISPATEVFGVIGCPVGHSMSPAIHNAAFSAAGIDAVYVPVRIEPGRDNFFRFMDALLERPWMDWRGLSVTIPHKENALAYAGADNCDDLARKIGAVNTLTISPGGKLRGDNTDYSAALDALCLGAGIDRQALAGKTVAVLGAGGAARAIIAALRHYGASVTIFNRSVNRAKALAEEFSCLAGSIDAAARLEAEIVINCTPLGMSPRFGESPLEAIPPGVKAVFDTIYNPVQTRLLRLAAAAGCKTVTGLEMFINQAVAQFETWTAAPAPRDVMRKVVLERLGAAEGR